MQRGAGQEEAAARAEKAKVGEGSCTVRVAAHGGRRVHGCAHATPPPPKKETNLKSREAPPASQPLEVRLLEIHALLVPQDPVDWNH